MSGLALPMRWALAAACWLVLSCACKTSSKDSPKAEEPPARPASKPRTSAADPRLETLVLGQVLLETSDPDGLLRGQESELGKALGAQLVSSGWLTARAEDVAEGRIARRVEATLSLVCKLEMPRGLAPGSIAVAVQSSLRFVSAASGDMQPRSALVVEHAFDSGQIDEINALASDILASAVASSGESLVARVRLRAASDAELLSALSVELEEASMKIWALELAAERGLRGAVPSAIAALSDADENLRSAAIAALVEIGDERAVAALSQHVDFKDYEGLAVVMEAVSAIGGEEAYSFLEFVRSGHADADLRQRADECIQRMQARGKGKATESVN